MKPREVPVHRVAVEYVETTPEFVQAFVDDVTANPMSLMAVEEKVRYTYLREKGDRLKVLVLVFDARGFNQLSALYDVYDYVLRTYKITDGLRDNLERDIDEMRMKVGR